MSRPPRAGEYVPTGRARCRLQRVGWWRPRDVLVLQIEVSGYDIEWPGMAVDRKFWRDARVTDNLSVAGSLDVQKSSE